MARTVSIANTYTVAANSSIEVPIYRVPPASKFRLKKVIVHFPPGTENYLLVAIKYGIKNVCPEQGYLQGEDTTIPLECDYEFDSDSKVIIYAKNNDTVESRTFSIVVIGELVEGGES